MILTVLSTLQVPLPLPLRFHFNNRYTQPLQRQLR
jgi:hypothetical protein